MTIKGQDEEDLCGDGIVLYLNCGGGSINSACDKMAQSYPHTCQQQASFLVLILCDNHKIYPLGETG